MLELVVDNEKGDKVDETLETQDDKVAKKKESPTGVMPAIAKSTRDADFANDRAILQSRRDRIISSDVYKAIQRVYDAVLAGQLTTFRQVASTLALQGIYFPTNEEDETENDGGITSTYLNQLRDLIESVEEGLPAQLFAISQSLIQIDEAQADNSTLAHLDDLEAEYNKAPPFPSLQRRIRAIRLIKKAQLIDEYRGRLHRIMRGEASQEIPDEIYQFQSDFFGDNDTPGCGLTINDLRPSSEERMLLNRLGGKGRGIHPVENVSAES